MIFERGITAETSSGTFHKIKIALDNDDLAALLTEHEPSLTVSDLTVRERFQLMELEVAILLVAEQASRLGTVSSEDATRVMGSAEKARSRVLDQILERVDRIYGELSNSGIPSDSGTSTGSGDVGA